MPDQHLSRLENEWITLQNQFDSYEKCSLAIKLTSIIICCILLFGLHTGLWATVIIGILWLQDGIWKTFQSRIAQRLEVVEQAIQQSRQNNQNDELVLGMQFNLAWVHSRPSAKGLVVEYVTQSLKPTVAYPHLALIVLVFMYHFFV